MKRIDLPEENEQSIYTRMISERESTAQTYLSEGDADKQRIVAETDREVQEMLRLRRKRRQLSMRKGNPKPQKFIMTHSQKTRSFTICTARFSRIRKQSVMTR